MNNYWQQSLANRLSRRRALIATGAGALGAAFLAACGGSDGGSGEVKDPSGLLAKREDSTKRAKRGGTWPNYVTADVQTLDPNRTTSGSALAPQGYSRLFMYRPSVYPDLPTGAVDPDSAEGAEISPDGLQITVKLRPDLKFDPRPPTNGRPMNAEDVKWSWNAFAATNSSRGELVNSLSPSAPYQSIQVVDNRTVAFKLAYPVASVLWQLAFQRYMWLMPVEAEGRYDARSEMRGNGPWRLLKWEPSIGYTFERNEAWHISKDQPYLDGMETRIISEYSARRAQLTSGNMWTLGGGLAGGEIRAEDVLTVKSEVPKLNLFATEFPVTRRPLIGFSYLPNSPFHDVRVRRAISMIIDREGWIDAFYNVSGFEKAGLPVDARWESHYMAGDAPFWIDPKGKGLGEGAQYFQHNIAEAKKLMQAAGHNNKLKVPGFQNGTAASQQVQSLQGMLNESGLFDISLETFPTAEWNIKFHLAEGKHEGIAFNQSTGQSGDIDAHISVRYNVGNGQRVMLPEVFPWYKKTQDLILAQRKELDEKKRAVLLEDLQKEMALQMPTVPWPGAASGFTLAWPHLANFGVFVPRSAQTPMIEVWPRYWYDESKKV
ncbi:MAG TPA: ABC transporter substrate-binding protein [Dehalococcoidia bacterium]|nr:ABC transporter substrate-binding protein [Dehalococcoidia bacterium]